MPKVKQKICSSGHDRSERGVPPCPPNRTANTFARQARPNLKLQSIFRPQFSHLFAASFPSSPQAAKSKTSGVVHNLPPKPCTSSLAKHTHEPLRPGFRVSFRVVFPTCLYATKSDFLGRPLLVEFLFQPEPRLSKNPLHPEPEEAQERHSSGRTSFREQNFHENCKPPACKAKILHTVTWSLCRSPNNASKFPQLLR